VVRYTVEHVSGQLGLQRFTADGGSLIGDPDYDQVAGSYPSEDET